MPSNLATYVSESEEKYLPPTHATGKYERLQLQGQNAASPKKWTAAMPFRLNIR